MEGGALKNLHSHWSFISDPSGEKCEIRAQLSCFFLDYFRSINLGPMARGCSFMSGGVFEHVLMRPRTVHCTDFCVLSGWLKIVSTFSGASDGSTICFCSFLVWRRARNHSVDFCELQHIKRSRSAASEWVQCSSFKLEYELKVMPGYYFEFDAKWTLFLKLVSPWVTPAALQSPDFHYFFM